MRHNTYGVRCRVRAAIAVVTCLIPAAAIGAPLGFAHQLSHSINDSPAPGPDGKRMVYLVGVAGREQLFIANLDGSKPVQLTRDDFDHEDPAWSPDGSKTDDDLRPPAQHASDIYVMDLKSRRATKIITGGVNTYPAVSPDGERLAFRRIAHNLTNHPAFDGWPSWSPDGSLIAFASNRYSSYEIFVMKPDGSEVQLVANTDGRATAPQWSRDGATLYFRICHNIALGADCQIYTAPSHAGKP